MRLPGVIRGWYAAPDAVQRISKEGGCAMSLGRILVEEFQPEVIKWLRERVEIVAINPWVEPERWEVEVSRVDAVISRKGKITREQMQRSKGRLKIIARTGVGVDPSRDDLEAAAEL